MCETVKRDLLVSDARCERARTVVGFSAQWIGIDPFNFMVRVGSVSVFRKMVSSSGRPVTLRENSVVIHGAVGASRRLTPLRLTWALFRL